MALAELPAAGDPETRAVLKRCVTARVALADLNRAADLIPSPRMLEISLPLLEARASSEIENIITSADTMFRYVRAADAADPATREALRYRTALLEGFGGLRADALGTETAVRTDGNGRTGRVLNTLFLVEQGLLSRPILYLSRFIIVHRAEYYGLLLDVTRAEAWEPWILYVLQGIEETATWTTAKMEAIRRLQDETSRFVAARAPRTHHRPLIDLMFEQPYCRISDVVEAGIAERQTASRYLHALVEIGVLRTRRLGREKLFFHPKLLGLLTEEPNEFEPYP